MLEFEMWLQRMEGDWTGTAKIGHVISDERHSSFNLTYAQKTPISPSPRFASSLLVGRSEIYRSDLSFLLIPLRTLIASLPPLVQLN